MITRIPMERGDVPNATRAVIDLGAIGENVSGIRKKIGPKRDLMAVVKADAYGHGAVEVGVSALNSGATCLGVAMPEEGGELRRGGVEAPILVLGLIPPEKAHKSIAYRLDQTICTLELAETLNQIAGASAGPIKVHIKVDTGMGRIGIAPSHVLEFARKVSQFPNLKLEGVYSHLPSADEEDKTNTKKQIAIFQQLLREMEHAGFKVPRKHIANSACVLDLPESYFDLVRPGIMIYGLYPSRDVSRELLLKPAMTVKTNISYLKRVPSGTPISYGSTYRTKKESLIATLPVGYADGYNRLLSNRGAVRIRGQYAPVVGRICMDMCLVDVTGLVDVSVGDEVVLFGKDPTADEIAEKIGTISYEVLCTLGKRVPRIYTR